jgi:hypothetical protein
VPARGRARKAVLGRGERGGPAAPGPCSCAASAKVDGQEVRPICRNTKLL